MGGFSVLILLPAMMFIILLTLAIIVICVVSAGISIAGAATSSALIKDAGLKVITVLTSVCLFLLACSWAAPILVGINDYDSTPLGFWVALLLSIIVVIISIVCLIKVAKLSSEIKTAFKVLMTILISLILLFAAVNIVFSGFVLIFQNAVVTYLM
jgi:hypothetical protein